MGGNVSITLREADGTVHKMCRSTGILPWLVVNAGLYRRDPAHIQAALEEWRVMRADWMAHQQSGQYEHEMTPYYAPHDQLAPFDYGLVVIDLQQGVILSNQDFAYLDSVVFAKLKLGWQPIERKLADPNSDLSRFKALVDGGYVSEMAVERNRRDLEGAPQCRETVDLRGQSFIDILTTLLGSYLREAPDAIAQFMSEVFVEPEAAGAVYDEGLVHWVNPAQLSRLNQIFERELCRDDFDLFQVNSPFAVEEFAKNSVAAARAFQARVRELGFDLTADDEAAWDAWIARIEKRAE